MAIFIPNEGELALLDNAIKNGPEDYKLDLYKSDVTLSAGGTAADVTFADFTSYAQKTVTRASLAASTINGSGKAQISFPAQTWTVGSGQTIYGWILRGATSGKILASEYLGGTALAANSQFTLTVNLTMSSEA